MIRDALAPIYSVPGGLAVLFFIFLALKLYGVIGWSWWWVCAPAIAIPGFYLSVAIGFIFFTDWSK